MAKEFYVMGILPQLKITFKKQNKQTQGPGSSDELSLFQKNQRGETQTQACWKLLLMTKDTGENQYNAPSTYNPDTQKRNQTSLRCLCHTKFQKDNSN